MSEWRQSNAGRIFSMISNADVVVIGSGGTGAATAYALSKRDIPKPAGKSGIPGRIQFRNGATYLAGRHGRHPS
jgi:glycine/D-amino acid oxidase-like deaminating enzyme